MASIDEKLRKLLEESPLFVNSGAIDSETGTIDVNKLTDKQAITLARQGKAIEAGGAGGMKAGQNIGNQAIIQEAAKQMANRPETIVKNLQQQHTFRADERTQGGSLGPLSSPTTRERDPEKMPEFEGESFEPPEGFVPPSDNGPNPPIAPLAGMAPSALANFIGRFKPGIDLTTRGIGTAKKFSGIKNGSMSVPALVESVQPGLETMAAQDPFLIGDPTTLGGMSPVNEQAALQAMHANDPTLIGNPNTLGGMSPANSNVSAAINQVTGGGAAAPAFTNAGGAAVGFQGGGGAGALSGATTATALGMSPLAIGAGLLPFAFMGYNILKQGGVFGGKGNPSTISSVNLLRKAEAGDKSAETYLKSGDFKWDLTDPEVLNFLKSNAVNELKTEHEMTYNRNNPVNRSNFEGQGRLTFKDMSDIDTSGMSLSEINDLVNKNKIIPQDKEPDIGMSR